MPCTLVHKASPGNPGDSSDLRSGAAALQLRGRNRTAVILCHPTHISWLPLGDSVLCEITEGRLKWWKSSQQESSQSNTDNKQDLFHLYGWYLFFHLRTFIWTYFPFHFQSAYESFSVIILEVWKFGITVLAIILLGWIFSIAINLRKQ